MREQACWLLAMLATHATSAQKATLALPRRAAVVAPVFPMSSSALGKRKAGDEPVAGATVANVSAARGPPVVSRRRERAMRQELRWLNSCFSQYVSARADSSEPLDGAAEDYLRYVRQIRAQYSDVLAPATPLQRRCGRVYVVGTGDMGQLGLGDDEDGIMVCQRPHPLDAFGLPVCVVACGGMHSLAITDDGGVWSWGVNDDGPLGREVCANVVRCAAPTLALVANFD